MDRKKPANNIRLARQIWNRIPMLQKYFIAKYCNFVKKNQSLKLTVKLFTSDKSKQRFFYMVYGRRKCYTTMYEWYYDVTIRN